MKTFTIVMAVVLMCASIALPQENKIKPVIYAGGGVGIPMTPSIFSDFWKMGSTFGGGFGLQFNPKSELIARVYYNTFPLDADKLLSLAGVQGASIDGLDFQSLEIFADFKYTFNGESESKALVYLIGGFGFSNYKFSDVTVSAQGQSISLPASELSESSFAVSSGIGVDIMFSPTMGIFVEPRFTVITTKGESTGYVPIRGGLRIMFGK